MLLIVIWSSMYQAYSSSRAGKAANTNGITSLKQHKPRSRRGMQHMQTAMASVRDAESCNHRVFTHAWVSSLFR